MKISGDRYRAFYSACYTALLAAAAVTGLALPRPTQATAAPLGVAVPLYTYPTDGSWGAVIHAKQSHPDVPFIAIINPNSGPGASQDSNYVQGIRNLQAAGVLVLGYVPTVWGAAGVASVEAQVRNYDSWYGVNGIMFDQMSNTASYVAYYSALDRFVHSLIPGSVTMGNIGNTAPAGLIGVLDILNIWEYHAYPPIAHVAYPGYSPSNFANIVYGVPLDATYLSSLVGVNSWVYVTDANLPNPYDVLPSYFDSEVADLSLLDGATTPVSSSTATSQLTVRTRDAAGDSLAGYYVALIQEGQVVSSGFSPASFTLDDGLSYVVESDGYRSCSFAYWLDTGSADPQRVITLLADTTLTAVLNCGSATSSTTTDTATETASTTVASATTTTRTASTTVTAMTTASSTRTATETTKTSGESTSSTSSAESSSEPTMATATPSTSSTSDGSTSTSSSATGSNMTTYATASGPSTTHPSKGDYTSEAPSTTQGSPTFFSEPLPTASDPPAVGQSAVSQDGAGYEGLGGGTASGAAVLMILVAAGLVALSLHRRKSADEQ